ncbi:MAG: alpha-2-macroglobulin, partial [Ferruginibacter sp.]
NQLTVAKSILQSLQQNSIYKEELGMYWKEFTTGGYYWHQAPIESHALMIEAFSDIEGNSSTINDLKTWLLKQKQTNNWRTSRATAEACYALLLGGSNWLAEESEVNIQLGDVNVSSTKNKTEAGSGFFSTTISGEKVKPAMGNIVVNIKSISNQLTLPGYGAVYWQYTEDLNQITSAATPLQLQKKLFKESNTEKGAVLSEIKEGDIMKVGDKIKIRIELKVDRNMEYIHMKDMRAAALEPLNVLSGYKWQGGLGYYESTKDASTNFFFGLLPRGTYVFEYELFASHAGNFSNGITSIQCMYAPEFTSHSEGVRINIE